MVRDRWVLAASIWPIAGMMLWCAGCTSTPETTRTGAVHDARILEGPSPLDLRVNSGDEVHWVNARALPVRIDLIALDPSNVACERGFSDWMGRLQESAGLKPGDSASICLRKPGEVKYNVRMTSALPGGQNIVSGTVTVERQ